MAIPSLTRTWAVTHTVLPALANIDLHYRAFWAAVFNGLLATGKWTMPYAMQWNGGVNGDDYLNVTSGWNNLATSFRWNTTYPSFMVFQQTASGAQLAFIFNHEGAGNYAARMQIAFSRTGFVAGGARSPSYLPTTGVSEWTCLTTTGGYGGKHTLSGGKAVVLGGTNGTYTPVQTVLNIWQSTDGLSTRLNVFYNNFSTCFIDVSPLTNATAGFGNPIACVGNSYTTGVPRAVDLLTTGTGFTHDFTYGTTAYTMTSTIEGPRSNNLHDFITVPNDLDSTWAIYGMGAVSGDIGARGHHGRHTDIWFSPSNIAEGSTFPNDTSRQFIVVGGIVLPWDGTVPQLA